MAKQKEERQGMKTSTKIWIGVGIVVLLLVFWIIGSYNGFVGMRQDVNSKWSEVENQYQRQADLIPNLVSVVSSAVSVETKFVKDVVALRTAWQAAKNDEAGVNMNNGISALVNAVAENYPTLQANKQYIALTDELSGTQNRIATARGRYIESVQRFNTAVKRFPGNVIAGMFGFNSVEYYEAETTKTPSLGTGQLP